METFKENLINKLGKEGFHKVQASPVAIAGVGGLGSKCALNLVRVGFRKLTIIDFDIVSAANLDRQFYFFDQVGKVKVTALKENLCRVNPDLELIICNKKIEKSNIKDLFTGYEIVAECLDSAENKSMLVNELLALDKFIVAVSGLGGVGSSDEIRLHRIKPNFIIVGDLKSDIGERPALSPRVNIAAAKQADVILDYVLNKL